MDLQLGTMLYRKTLGCESVGMIISKTAMPLRGKSDPKWVYGVEWYYETPVQLGDGKDSYFSNSKYLSAYRHAYIELKRNINAS